MDIQEQSFGSANNGQLFAEIDEALEGAHGLAPIAVIGDMMLDCYLHGDVERMSPEAPVPVVRHSEERHVPGGAANVASNIASLGFPVEVVGLVGTDHARLQLISALSERAVGTRGVVAEPMRRTTTKMRVIGSRQQIVRVDVEDRTPLSQRTEDWLISAAEMAIASASAVIISDYNKNVLSDRILNEVISCARGSGKMLLVDPKRRDWSAYRGASIVTPNRKELTEATGLPCESDEEAAKAVARVQNVCNASILLTRSEKGMSFYPIDGEPIHVRASARDVFDVSGAGDTVIATLAAGLASNLRLEAALHMANAAASIVVGKIGTSSVTRAELSKVFATTDTIELSRAAPHLSWVEAADLRARWKRQGMLVGFSNGCFDLVHPGHISLIKQAARACDRLIVALNSDASVRRLKGPNRPVQSEDARAEVIASIKGVSGVVIFDEETPLNLISLLQPDVLIKGADYTEETVIGGDIVKAAGGRIVLARLSPGQSTTAIIGRSSSSSARAGVKEE
jgi:D-beta-D-heptose 7-phosphate kinase/D-beta-D-heptose 1-phosphate adenosyltransferase